MKWRQELLELVPSPPTILELQNVSLVGKGHSVSPRVSVHATMGLLPGVSWAVRNRVLAGFCRSRKGENDLEKALPNPGPHRPGWERTQQREQKSIDETSSLRKASSKMVVCA